MRRAALHPPGALPGPSPRGRAHRNMAGGVAQPSSGQDVFPPASRSRYGPLHHGPISLWPYPILSHPHPIPTPSYPSPPQLLQRQQQPWELGRLSPVLTPQGLTPHPGPAGRALDDHDHDRRCFGPMLRPDAVRNGTSLHPLPSPAPACSPSGWSLPLPSPGGQPASGTASSLWSHAGIQLRHPGSPGPSLAGGISCLGSPIAAWSLGCPGDRFWRVWVWVGDKDLEGWESR